MQADFDGRDNKMTPNRGQLVELVAWKHLEALGGETDYWKVGFQVQSFHEMMHEKLVLGFHLDLDTAGGDPPIWGYPWISMRGIPGLRYQNESTGVLETELRWDFLERWAVVGFVGVGATRGDTDAQRRHGEHWHRRPLVAGRAVEAVWGVRWSTRLAG